MATADEQPQKKPLFDEFLSLFDRFLSLFQRIPSEDELEMRCKKQHLAALRGVRLDTTEGVAHSYTQEEIEDEVPEQDTSIAEVKRELSLLAAKHDANNKTFHCAICISLLTIMMYFWETTVQNFPNIPPSITAVVHTAMLVFMICLVYKSGIGRTNPALVISAFGALVFGLLLSQRAHVMGYTENLHAKAFEKGYYVGMIKSSELCHINNHLLTSNLGSNGTSPTLSPIYLYLSVKDPVHKVSLYGLRYASLEKQQLMERWNQTGKENVFLGLRKTVDVAASAVHTCANFLGDEAVANPHSRPQLTIPGFT